ncbi:ROK family protein [Mesorhizobium sp. M1C.F.Ca.ET.193.01.1.1]|uniref:ROK family protein n=1 Tax=unclassified Mesorhizobium TaxID=325217 RepID=UPI000FD4D452|nr:MULTISPECIES: ROK family protein [unclassified Mesorhizobium]TGT01854.1 ROK family protein [bacterium M00.F.Ca.ET.177.01.1.1]TGQ54703.1 ROK family protein [Mesorhizobium sp. M1C.F.Ca.ET.210.01.1.1]TGQ73482.1 ROK family protein [Mesorhizobium sp. M1C.F.Ca.ET.212.01.1.1]TGR10932.1 ROK family protein [Mesorhizobium sp. M1C.F.Ca.ET.204.01.1.1]TGR31516.1 ROK family protein [Mesorhizobium sp. M1C.F.Ca.ET.196.01.1.1]
MPHRSMAIGIDIGGTNLRAALISGSGEILRRVSEKSAPDPELVLGRIADMTRRLDASEVAAIGVGVPGRVDALRRAVLSGGYVDLASVALAQRLENMAGKPVIIDNDCNMALSAEMALGAAAGRGNIVMFTIGTGIGGAVAEGGRIVRGSATAGQLGHIGVDLDGAVCKCGRRGCVETTSSGTALGRHIARAGLGPDVSVDQLFARAASGDIEARAVLDVWARPLRAAIDTAVAMFSPDLVLLGGGLGEAAHRALAEAPALATWYQAPVQPAKLGDEAGVIGAGLQALAAQASTASARPARGRRAILVNGIPASGKSTVSRGISQRMGWPLLALDTVKNPFLEILGGADREFNRTLGRASYQAIWSIVGETPAGSIFVVDAWFGFQPRELLEQHLSRAGVGQTAEVWCHAPGEVLAERYRARLDQRLPGHPGAAYIPELVELAKRAEPLRRGPLFDVDTTKPVDFDAITAWLREVMG